MSGQVETVGRKETRRSRRKLELSVVIPCLDEECIPFQGGIRPGSMPWLHEHLGNTVLSFIGRRLFGTACGDIYCGLRGFDPTCSDWSAARRRPVRRDA